ncbi:MAG: hypothetical protein KF763_15685 [Cyclobacteriaceae bacterium]|nr:hypothetical protein [Cyclobacteriaceae bacterium]
MKYCSVGIILCFVFLQSAGQIIEPPRGNLSQAKYISVLTDSLAIAEKAKDTINIIRYTAVLTTQWQGTANDKATYYLLYAFRYAKAHPNPKWYADVCNRAGMLMLTYSGNNIWLRKLNRTTSQMQDSSLYWHRQAVYQGIKIGRYGTAGWGYRGLMQTALSHYNNAVKDSIPFYYKRAMEMARYSNDQELVSYSNLVYSDYLDEVGKEEEAIEVLGRVSSHYFPNNLLGYSADRDIPDLIDNLSKTEELLDTINVIKIAFNLSGAFRSALMKDQATSYLNLAFRYAEAYGDSVLLAYTYLNAGELMIELNKQDSARHYYNKAAKIRLKVNPVGWAYAKLMEMAIDYPDNHPARDSIPFYYNTVKEIARLQSNIFLMTTVEIFYCKYLVKNGDMQKAESVLRLLSYRQHQLDPVRKEKLYLAVHDYLAQVNKLDTLIKLRKLFIHQHDMLTAATHQDQLYAKDRQYEVTKTKNILSETSNRLSSTNKALISSLIVLFMFACLITYLFFLFRKNKRLSQRNELLLREQNHRVKNNLQMISSLLSLQSQKLTTSDAKAVLEDSQGRINSVALLHRMLYEGDQVGQIEVVSYIKSLTEEIKYGANRDVDIELALPEKLELKIERVTSLGLIVNELFTNSIKHVSSEIRLRIRLQLEASNGKLNIAYSDNGAGVTREAWMASNSFGNQLIQLQTRQLQGDFTVNVDHGFDFGLRIPA